MPINIASMAMSATYRAKVEHSILSVKIVNRYFERPIFFGGATSVVLMAVL